MSGSVQLFKTSEAHGLPYKLATKTIANYMITVNINTCDRLVNGSTGQIMQFDFHCSFSAILLIKFFESFVGLIALSEKPHPQESAWTSIEKVLRSFRIKEINKFQLKEIYFQFRLRE